MNPQDLEDIVSGAARQGWDWFGGASEEEKKNLEVAQELNEENRKAVASAWAEFASSPGGQKALEALFDATLRRTVFYAHLGHEPMAMAVFGAFREGQNAVAYEIARQINAGRNEETKPRDRL